MADLVLYHNPRCSKSRNALALVRERGADVEVVEYLKTPPSRADLDAMLDGLDGPPAELLRRDDLRALGLDPADYTERDAVVGLLVEHPELLQRPVLVAAGRAVIGRPPDAVLALLG